MFVNGDCCGNCGENIFSCNCCTECGGSIFNCGGVEGHKSDRIKEMLAAFSDVFIDEICQLALQIAYQQRGENRMQPVDTLWRKFRGEVEEYHEASEKWDEIPDLVYYATCLHGQGDSSALSELRQLVPASVSAEQLMAGTLAKYRMRATQPKNIELERAAILAAVL